MRKVLAIGAHIGDAELTSGPLLAQTVAEGGRAKVLALTCGERGNPNMEPSAYKRQKLEEARAFANGIGAEFEVFEDLDDGLLTANEENAQRIVDVVKDFGPTLVTGHWTGSWHPDHVAAAELTRRATFLAGLDFRGRKALDPAPKLAHAENWEDMIGFHANRYIAIGDDAFEHWMRAISLHSFAHGGFSGFHYIDYYASLMTVKGCLAGTRRACAFQIMSDALQPIDQ